jgi:hypothetical protein
MCFDNITVMANHTHTGTKNQFISTIWSQMMRLLVIIHDCDILGKGTTNGFFDY